MFTERADVFRLVTESKDDNLIQDALGARDFDTAYGMMYEQCLIIESAAAINGSDLLLAEEEKARDLHWDGTGLEGLDEVLHGFEGRGIIEMTGKTGVGKTVSRESYRRYWILPLKTFHEQLLSLHVVLRHLSLDPSVTCTWIDTRASFSPARAQQVLQALSVSVCIALKSVSSPHQA